MRTTWKRTASAVALVLAAVWGTTDGSLAGEPGSKSGRNAGMPGQTGTGTDSSIMRIPANAQFPINRQITIGRGRSMMLQFPLELRDVMIADPQKVDAVVQTSDRVFLIAKQPGSTNAFFFDAQGNQIMTLEINVGSDLSSLDDLLRRMLPGSQIRTELAGAAVVLMGSVRTPADAQRAMEIAKQYAAANKSITGNSIQSTRTEVGGVTTWQISGETDRGGNQNNKPVINLLTVEGEEQVMLKVTVAEVNRSVLKQFGVNLATSFSAGNFAQSFGTMNTFPITATTLGALNKAGVVTAGAPAGTAGCANILPQIHPSYVGQSGFSGGWGAGNNCLAHTLQALEREGLMRTLAEPTLTAVSGESARFLAGGEYPVPISAENGAIGISFKEFGVGVAFTPLVMSEGRISLKIETHVSELSNEGALVLSGTQIPSLRKRTAHSVVELPSGGSMAIAGLISENTRQSIEGFPGLKDVPVLGTLFRSRDYQQNETELVVIVTPYMVRPTARQNLARPDDGLAAASDLKANFLGELNRRYGKGKSIPDGGLKGDHGYIVD